MAKFEVLLASDFTARSDRPTERAIQLTDEKDGALVIAHVLEKGAGATDAVADRLRTDLPASAENAELVIRTGSAPKTLTAIATERASDLIVTGVARYNSIGDYFLGTAVDHIVRNAAQPVLVVRRRAKRPYDRLLVASDLSECSHTALFSAAEIFPTASMTLVHAFHVPFEGLLKSDEVQADVRAEAQEQLDAYLKTVDRSIRARLEAKLVEGEIGTVVADELANADLLVLGTHGRSGFVHATIGSQAEALLASVNADVLLVRETT